MVATDTVVGIVGAVVLVAVMVGVFVYEYNNAGTDDGEPDGFAARYPGLNATEDLDGDGIANRDDPDMDGDGVEDGQDAQIATTNTSSGSVGPVPATGSLGFYVGTGNILVNITVQGEPTLDRPTIADFTVTLVGPDGQDVATSNSGGTETYTITDDSGLAAGDYRVEVEPAPGSLGGGFSIEATVVYTA